MGLANSWFRNVHELHAQIMRNMAGTGAQKLVNVQKRDPIPTNKANEALYGHFLCITLRSLTQ